MHLHPTQLEWHPTNEHCFCSGSYDETLRIWDDRNVAKPVSEVTIQEGGVWRTKWSVADDGTYILAAAMHAGCSLIKLDSCSFQVSKMFTYKDETSQNMLCYGASILNRHSLPSREYGNGNDNDIDKKVVTGDANFTIGSCSFYEDVIHVWSCTL